MKRKRRIEITRYSRRITVMYGGGDAEFVADGEAADGTAPKMSGDAPFMPEESDGGRGGVEAARTPLRRRLLKFLARLRRQC